MLLSDIFTALSTGELSQVSLGTTSDGEITMADQPKVITSINLGMTELYKKFVVIEKEVDIQMYDNITLYELSSKYAISNTESTEPFKYIQDSAVQPFQDDVLRIHQVYDEIGGELILNNLDEDESLFTPINDVLQVPNPTEGSSLAIIYRGKPVKIPLYGIDPAQYEVALPDYLLEPLLFYTASRTVPNIGAANGEPSFYQKYIASCDNIRRQDFINKDSFTNAELEKNGWV